MARVYLGIGTNQGDRMENLRLAVCLLRERGVRVRRASSVFETAPVGLEEQPSFLNAVLEVETDLEPEALLDVLMAVEAILGRVRRVRWGPRTLDLDILLYDDARLNTPRLTVPHPYLHQRRFVLAPLVELSADLIIPGLGTARQCLEALDEHTQPVQKVGPFPLV